MKKMDCFSVTMADVSTSLGYAMVLMTVKITVMNQRHTVLFVVCVLDSFVSLAQIFSLSNYNSINHATRKQGFIRNGFRKSLICDQERLISLR